MALWKSLTKRNRAGVLSQIAAAIGVVAFALTSHSAHADEILRSRFFAYRVQPLLSDKCFRCHGPDAEQRPTDLRLDTEAGVREAFGGADVATSEAWRRITSDDDSEVMPPAESHKSFSAEELATLREWIENGAEWAPHWAFISPIRVVPPVGFGGHPIDAFIRRRLEAEGLKPAPPAEKAKLLRRASFDLTGIPPTLKELDAFLADESPDAWSHQLDRLLASPRYGERMAVMWLDGARYADTNGYQNDFQRTMWPWRDWVIRAFNSNKPYDEFIIEQIAGDLLPDATFDQRLATAFNRNNRTVTEAGSLPEEWLVENVVDRVETTSSVVLGLTMGCARCHDHKYDPISQREFFEFFAFFNNVNEEGVYVETRGNVGPTVTQIGPEEQTDLDRLVDCVQSARAEVESQRSAVAQAAERWYASAETPKGVPTACALVGLDDADYLASVADQPIAPGGEGPKPTLDASLLGPVAHFDGASWLEYQGLFTPQANAPFSVTAWVKPTAGGALFSKMDDSAAFHGVDALVSETHQLAVHLIDAWPANALKVVTEASLPKDRWSLVSVTYDGSGKAAGVKVFFGAQEQPLRIEADSLTGDFRGEQPLRVGRRSASAPFDGAIGRLRLFDRAITVGDLQGLIAYDLLQPAAKAAALTSLATQDSTAPADTDRDDAIALYINLAPDKAARDLADAEHDLAAAEEEEKQFRELLPTCMVMQERPDLRPTYVLRRGAYDQPDLEQPVSKGVPAFLGVLPGEKPDRLTLAQWLVDRENPLTARVLVNRVWGLLFGVGLVKSEENFGVQGDAPSHPDLLDWLAVDFMESGWDLKRLLRLIMASETYQQSSVVEAGGLDHDPDNRLMARGPRRRLPAEFVRDNALAVSGLLRERRGGPSVRPYQPEGLWEELAGGAGEGPYVVSQGPDLYRRSLYTYRKRTVSHPTMAVFDAPSFEICVVKRATTNTPLQALALLNDTTYVEAARVFGERMLQEGGASDTARLRFGFRLATSRYPTDTEMAMLLAALNRAIDYYASDPAAAEALLSVGESPRHDGLPQPQAAGYATVATLLLNLDESVTLE